MQTLAKIEIVRSTRTARGLGVIAHDVDNNMADSDPRFHALENAHDWRTAARLRLDVDFFTRVRKGDVRDFQNAYDLAYAIPVVVQSMGLDWSVEKCQAETEVYLEGILKREREVRLYPGVPEALAEMRVRFPGHTLMAITDCPLWLAVHRLDVADIFKHFDSLVAVHLGAPQALWESKFRPVAEWIARWLDSRLKQAPVNLESLVGLPQVLAKPNATGPLAVLESGGYSKDGRFVIFDDKPCKGGCLRDNLRHEGVDAFFVHTKIGKHDPVVADGPQPDGEVVADFREGLAVLERLI
jgi:hypothetical protein